MFRFLSIAIACCIFPLSVQAAINIVISEVGDDVQMNINGTIDMSGAPSIGIGASQVAQMIFSETDFTIWSGTTDPGNSLFADNRLTNEFAGSPLGAGWASLGNASSSSGHAFGFLYNSGGGFFQVFVPSGFPSGPIASQAIWENTTLAGVGLNPGTLSWISSTPGNNITLTVVPEPSTFALVLGLVTFCFLARHRRN